MMELISITIVALGIGVIAVAIGYSEQNSFTVFCGVLALILACLFSALAVNFNSAGYIEKAEIKLSPGETYECIAGPTKDGDIHYSVVKTGNGRIYGLQFKKLPPVKGIVSKTENKITFLPIVMPTPPTNVKQIDNK